MAVEKILAKKSFPQWLSKLDAYTVYAPVEDEGRWDYRAAADPAKIALDHPNTVQAPKKMIFPQREVLMEFGAAAENGYKVEESLPGGEPVAIFGVRPCDAKALTLTDRVFSGDFDDPYYRKRREAATLVGLACAAPPSENCFCLSIDGSPFDKTGLDAILVDLNDRYYVEALTDKGEQLIGKAADLFKDASGEHKKEVETLRAASEKKIARQVNEAKKVPPKLKGMFDSPFWDEESLACIRCGICTYLCPTCHCFDINDEVTAASPLKGKRVRTWDNCQFPDFTMHSSGHNPRPDRASRLRQRILHKYRYFVERYENYQCTGCGRCVSRCPVGIDIIDILNKVNDYAT